ncbi:MAG: phospho-sugar mutase [Ruminococcaceae bacterium]|nr:phospho-sugar mutase [Oscillospiraceae bacterium]
MINEAYKKWLEKATADSDLTEELLSINTNQDEINDRFYRNLEFGTAGLRGVIGAGTNRMNIYTVGAASQGLAEYVNSITNAPKIAIAYDSRIKSDLFAKHAASVFAANGVTVYLYPELAPTPMLSFAVRYLKCDAGIVITASHNPSKYNGYKAYGPDGCQLGLEASEYVLSIIEKLDIFADIKSCDFDTAVNEGKIKLIGEDVVNAYLDAVQSRSVADESYNFGDMKVIYTPLHGAGNKPVRAILKRIGINNVVVVPEQELPDGNFPTAPYPNPEIRQAFECALELAKKENPDLLLATDPDSDRVGIAVKYQNEFHLMSGNDVGALLLNYILERKTALGTLPKNPVAVKTIVSTNLVNAIAADYGCELKEVLTGFKFIGEQVLLLEQKGEEDRFIFGFEESYGYLAGSYVRDKDAVIASMLICEMCCYYKAKGMTLIEVLDSLYKKYGYFYSCQKSITCEGQDGMEKMANAMKSLRENPPMEIAGFKTLNVLDYSTSLNLELATQKTSTINLPKSNVLSYVLEDGAGAIVRPSGTEPKIKFYIFSVGDNLNSAISTAKIISDDMEKYLNL